MPTFRTNPDGTLLYQQQGMYSVQVAEPAQIPGDMPAHVDDLTALQIGLWAILDSIEAKSVDRAGLILRGRTHPGAPLQLHRVFLDWPDSEDRHAPRTPSAVIRQIGDAKYVSGGAVSGEQVDEDTVDRFAPDTVLRTYGEVETTLQVECVFANKDDRAAYRKALVPILAAEPTDERPGRRVVIRQYYDEVARYDLTGITYDDDSRSAQSKLFPLVVSVNGVIRVVAAVPVPAAHRPRVGLDI